MPTEMSTSFVSVSLEIISTWITNLVRRQHSCNSGPKIDQLKLCLKILSKLSRTTQCLQKDFNWLHVDYVIHFKFVVEVGEKKEKT